MLPVAVSSGFFCVLTFFLLVFGFVGFNSDDSKNVWVGIAREEPQSAIELWDLYSQKIVHILRCPTSEKTGT